MMKCCPQCGTGMWEMGCRVTDLPLYRCPLCGTLITCPDTPNGAIRLTPLACEQLRKLARVMENLDGPENPICHAFWSEWKRLGLERIAGES